MSRSPKNAVSRRRPGSAATGAAGCWDARLVEHAFVGPLPLSQPSGGLLSEKSWERGWREHLRAQADGPTAVGGDLPLDGRFAAQALWSRVDHGQRARDPGHDRGRSAVEAPHAVREVDGGWRRA